MKKYRALVPVVLIVLMVLSWYMLVSEAAKTESNYNKYLLEARKYAEIGVTKRAIENYNAAIKIKSSPEIYVEVAEYYKNQKKDAEYLSWCKVFFEEYPIEVDAYECLLTAYYSEKDYEACFDVLNTAGKRGIKSDFIDNVSNEIKYTYKIDFSSYNNVGVYGNNYCAVKSKDSWGFVDRFGNQRISTIYSETGVFTNSNVVSVVNKEGQSYFIDKSGAKVMASRDKYKSFGLLSENLISAKREDNKYIYVDSDFNVKFGDYDYASSFNLKIAAVKNGNEWQLINTEGKSTSSEKYIDIKIDEKQIAYRNDRAFVSNEAGKYIMIDSKGKQIGNMVFEDAKVFAGDAPTAVKINGNWHFIKKDGTLLSDKIYENARPFLNGLAAVCIDGKWGFIDEKEELVIKNEFFDAKDFNEKGSCFVKNGDRWQLLKLYRLNREE